MKPREVTNDDFAGLEVQLKSGIFLCVIYHGVFMQKKSPQKGGFQTPTTA